MKEEVSPMNKVCAKVSEGSASQIQPKLKLESSNPITVMQCGMQSRPGNISKLVTNSLCSGRDLLYLYQINFPLSRHEIDQPDTNWNGILFVNMIILDLCGGYESGRIARSNMLDY